MLAECLFLALYAMRMFRTQRNLIREVKRNILLVMTVIVLHILCITKELVISTEYIVKKFTNKFHGSKCETEDDIDDCESIERRSVVQNIPTVSTESDTQNNDLHVGIENQNIAQTDCDARYRKRTRSRPKHLNDYVLADNFVNYTVRYCYRMSDTPTSYGNAMASVESQNWKTVMEEEMNSLLDNDTFRLTSRPECKKVVG
jgi:hypothetical protein